MKNLLFCLCLILLVGCETYTLTMETKTGAATKEYTLTRLDFLADDAISNEEMPSNAGIGVEFPPDNVNCVEYKETPTSNLACCCNKQISRKVFTRIHRCGK